MVPLISLYDLEGRLHWASSWADGGGDYLRGRYLWEFGNDRLMRDIWEKIVRGKHVTWNNQVVFNGHVHRFTSRSMPRMDEYVPIMTWRIQLDFTALTPGQESTLRLACVGLTSTQIAAKLHRSQSSVTSTIHTIKRRLGVTESSCLFFKARIWFEAEYDVSEFRSFDMMSSEGTQIVST